MNTAFPHRFVDVIPKEPEERVLFVSIEHAVAVHRCACGCGRKVVTPLAPVHWKLIFDGRSVSLYPSIGNHAFPCKSHYWLENGRVRWSYEMSQHEVEAVRAQDKRRRAEFYGEAEKSATRPAPPSQQPSTQPARQPKVAAPRPWWKRWFD
ncbi:MULTISPECIES: DUF6527 family protein [Stenotrophomonas]|jgi:hypothetical protein|uniref:DUF6527 family protein n=1 Tax=Stenotrophomonas maltophilia TaxID=40324 RepID=UPI001C60A520